MLIVDCTATSTDAAFELHGEYRECFDAVLWRRILDRLSDDYLKATPDVRTCPDCRRKRGHAKGCLFRHFLLGLRMGKPAGVKPSP